MLNQRMATPVIRTKTPPKKNPYLAPVVPFRSLCHLKLPKPPTPKKLMPKTPPQTGIEEKSGFGPTKNPYLEPLTPRETLRCAAPISPPPAIRRLMSKTPTQLRAEGRLALEPKKNPYLVPFIKIKSLRLVKPRPPTPKKVVPQTPLPPGAEDDSGFGRLPVELKTKIFQWFNFGQRKVLRLVCPSWRAIIDDTLEFSASLDNPKGSWIPSCSHFKSLEVQNWTSESKSAKLRNVPRRSELRGIEDLVIGKGNSEQNVIILLCTPIIKSLTMKNLALSQVTTNNLRKYLPDFDIGGIKKLSLGIGCPNCKMQWGDLYRQNLAAVLFLLGYVNFRVLKTLSVNLTGVELNLAEFSKSLLEILSLSFPTKYKKPIKKLKLFLTGNLDENFSSPSMQLTKQVESCSVDVRLEKLTIMFDSSRNGELATLLLVNFYRPSSLKLLVANWIGNSFKSFEARILRKSLTRIFERIGPNLQKLELQLVDFCLNALQCLPCLKSVDLRVHLMIFNEPPNPSKKLQLSALKKISVTTSGRQQYYMPEILTSRIAKQFPNVEDVELVLLGGDEISAKTFQAIFRIPSIRRVMIGHNKFTCEFINSIFEKSVNDPKIRFHNQGTINFAKFNNRFRYQFVEFRISTLVLPKQCAV